MNTPLPPMKRVPGYTIPMVPMHLVPMTLSPMNLVEQIRALIPDPGPLSRACTISLLWEPSGYPYEGPPGSGHVGLAKYSLNTRKDSKVILARAPDSPW
jgi:hypothetical protein